jgi:hypothetical protein
MAKYIFAPGKGKSSAASATCPDASGPCASGCRTDPARNAEKPRPYVHPGTGKKPENACPFSWDM